MVSSLSAVAGCSPSLCWPGTVLAAWLRGRRRSVGLVGGVLTYSSYFFRYVSWAGWVEGEGLGSSGVFEKSSLRLVKGSAAIFLRAHAVQFEVIKPLDSHFSAG